MPELVKLADKRAAVEGILREAIPRLRIDLPPAMQARVQRFCAGAYDCMLADPTGTLLEAAYNDPQRLRGAVIEAARLGLWIGPTMSSDSHLVAFKNKGVPKLQLIPNYRGLSKVAYNTGVIKAINTGTVREGDVFEWDEGTDPHVSHKKATKRGECTYAWAAINLQGGGNIVKVMTFDEIAAVRACSPGKDSIAWTHWWDEQAEKTVLKRALKKAPRSEELARVMELDDEAAGGKEQRFQAEVAEVKMPELPPAATKPKKPEPPPEPPADDPDDDPDIPEDAPDEDDHPIVWDEAGRKASRQRVAKCLKALGVGDDLRETWVGTFGLKGGLTDLPDDELFKIETWLETRANRDAVVAWATKARA